ncbi:TetR/AcrR family transcriptional regulator [Rubellimicrobium roseum]|uniref:TetR/AcrR family transcriptional regulator n=1 Tax=Rubellimicrobium roseum TaxID=687525 RepID=UPI00159BD404|nr:TetR/AcrR family transcriptional regulator [Rubellimicrobium roseum]
MPHELLSTQAARTTDGHDGPARGDEILTLARHAFVEKGFDKASMQDLARAAGMSAGNFYRYFPSKAAIVEALIARDMAEIEEAFQAIVASPDPVGGLKVALRQELGKGCDKDEALWAEIAAQAPRKPEIAALLGRMEDVIVLRVAQVLGRAAGISDETAMDRFGDDARLVFIIMHGAMTSNLMRTALADRLTDRVLRTIDRVLDEALAESKES